MTGENRSSRIKEYYAWMLIIQTAMTDALDQTQHERLLGAIPAGRLGLPEDIAASVVFLASEEAGYVTGQTLHVNGGMAMI